MRHIPVARRTLSEALAVAPALASLADRVQQPVCTASCFLEEAVVLGALQVAGRVLRDPLEGTVLRRTTSGTAAHFASGGVVFTLALPSIDSVFRDASPSTILNRNLRLFLAGFAHAGIQATYLGREWLAHKLRPIALVGLDVMSGGVVVVEVFVALEGTLELPRLLMTDLEASCDHYRGKAGMSLRDVSRLSSAKFAETVIGGIIERAGTPGVESVMPSIPFRDAVVHERWSPLPEGSAMKAPTVVPIGYLDSATTPRGERFVGGDVLGPVHALGFGISHGPERDPIIGATWGDVASLLR